MGLVVSSTTFCRLHCPDAGQLTFLAKCHEQLIYKSKPPAAQVVYLPLSQQSSVQDCPISTEQQGESVLLQTANALCAQEQGLTPS